MALTEDEELELLELEKQQSLSSSQKDNNAVEQTSPGVQPQNILGQIFNVPGAANRSAIKGTGYAYGAANPDKISTFQEDGANLASDMASKLPRQLVGPAAFAGSSLAQLAGMVVDSATNPAEILATISGGKAISAIAKTRAGKVIGNFINKKVSFSKSPEQLIKEAEKKTTEILNPTKRELALSNRKGRVLPAVEESANIIKEAVDGEDLLNQIKNARKSNILERNNLIKKDNFKVDTSNIISKLEAEISSAEKLGQNADEIMQMKKVLAEEKAFFVKNGDNFDRMSAEARKEYLQTRSPNLLNKRSRGISIDMEPGKTKAIDILRNSLKESVEGGDKRIKDLNSTYGPLLRAEELISEQNALAQKAVKDNLFQRIIHIATNPKDATFQALRRSGSIGSDTSKVERLMSTANKKIHQRYMAGVPKSDVLLNEVKDGKIVPQVTNQRWNDILAEAKRFKKSRIRNIK